VKFFQPNAIFSDFCDLCKPLPKWGLSNEKMARCLREQGLHVSIQRIDLERIEKCISNRQLVLTCIGGEHNDDHWIVIHGVNPKGRILYSGRVLPGFTRTSMSWKKFRKRCNSVMLVVYDD
jgi:hypothetical protein